ncbi:MAG TPA: RluA family pseudouridine synthase [Spirochaetota bacterium]|nr:RluA family pseudouridine synthase [Spirochaetota bacterium]HPR37820.1 RluA family pseudouridine synthase [Spirochaetota bacterium]
MNLKRGSVLPDILFEDDYIIAVNKPAGLLAQRDSTGRESLQRDVTDYLKENNSANDEPYCVALHRLDRPVSGIMLFAKSPVAAGRLSDDIKHRNIRKFYCALVSPAVETDSNNQWIEMQQFMVRRRDRGYIVSKDEPGATAVSLRYRIFETYNSSSLALIDLISGKRHQIRVQLSSLGAPVIGDKFYGSKTVIGEEIIALHAHYICFTHPITHEHVTLNAPIPQYMLDRFRESPAFADYNAR